MNLMFDVEIIKIKTVITGKVYALSYGTCIDSNDCLAILPTGNMKNHAGQL